MLTTTLAEATMAAQVSKKRKFVADGVFKAELNEFLTRELAEDGYSGVEVGKLLLHLAFLFNSYFFSPDYSYSSPSPTHPSR